MSQQFHRKSILKKTIQIGGSTLMSRVLGIIRDLLMIRFLGVGLASDAFITAYRIPNSLRKVFAEGALSAAFIPSFVTTMRHKEKEAFSLMSLAFLLFEGSLLIVCALIMIHAQAVVRFQVPGFSAEQLAATVPLLRILMPFIFFISSSALLAGGLQAVGHFFVPAFGPILLNIFFIAGILACWFLGLPIDYLCYFILLGGLFQFLQHLFTYFKLNLSFGPINKQTWHSFHSILGKFFLCALSMSVMEISLFIGTQFASFLPEGSVTLINYANRFLGIPLGVFAVAFSTILLPYFSRISTYAPKRLNFYLFESAKLVFWVTVPCMIAMIFFAQQIFITFFVSESFTMAHAYEAGNILIAFTIGLFFFSLNKIILNIYYAFHQTLIPGIISVIATLVNVGFNFLLIKNFATVGLALATTISGILQTILLLWILKRRYGLHGYILRFGKFAVGYLAQVALVGGLFLVAYNAILAIINRWFAPAIAFFFLNKIGFWMWVGPLCLLAGLLLYLARNRWNVRLYFLE
jgi:putative peptidoglycan lipid II flippase